MRVKRWKVIFLQAALGCAFTALGGESSVTWCHLGELESSHEIAIIADKQLIFPRVEGGSGATQRGHLVLQGDEIKKVLTGCRLNPKHWPRIMSDVEGEYVLPGLQDANVYAFGYQHTAQKDVSSRENPGLEVLGQRLLYSGITSYHATNSAHRPVSPAARGPVDDIMQFRQRVQNGEVLSPRLLAPGGIFTGLGAHKHGSPNAYDRDLATVEDVQLFVRSYIRGQTIQSGRPDYITILHRNKGYGGQSKIPHEHLRAMIQTANEEGKKVIAVISSWQDVKDVLEASEGLRLDAITYVPVAGSQQGGLQREAIVAQLKAREVTVITSLVLYHNLSRLFSPGEAQTILKEDLVTRLVPRQLRRSFGENGHWDPRWQWLAKKSSEFWTSREKFENFKFLKDQGVRVLAGTSSALPGSFFGVSLIQELAYYKEAGVSDNYEILAAATTDPGDFYGTKTGRLQAGYKADLLVLKKSPVDQIENLRSVSAVILGGQKIDREALNLGVMD